MKNHLAPATGYDGVPKGGQHGSSKYFHNRCKYEFLLNYFLPTPVQELWDHIF